MKRTLNNTQNSPQKKGVKPLSFFTTTSEPGSPEPSQKDQSPTSIINNMPEFFSLESNEVLAMTSSESTLHQDNNQNTQQILKKCFISFNDPIPVFRSNNKKKLSKAEFTISSINTLKTLLEEMGSKKEKPKLRFLVDTAKKTWFAREHNGIGGAPAHYQMTGNTQQAAQCITAGNIVLSDDYKTLVKINHKSGDFEPSFNSLKWFLAILILNESILPFKLPDTLTIEQLYPDRLLHELNKEEIEQWISSMELPKPKTAELTDDQPKVNNVVDYQKPTNYYNVSAHTPSIFQQPITRSIPDTFENNNHSSDSIII